MNIIWNKNPLAAVIKLDDLEKQILRLKIKLENYEDRLFSAWFYLTDDKIDIEHAKRELNPDSYMDDDGNFEKQIDKLADYFIGELSGVHVGDCTCYPCSCSKCHAEDLLGIHTLKGLNKHGGHKIDGMFRANPDLTLDQAIDQLENYVPIKGAGWEGYSQEEFNQYVPRWTAQAESAAEWLRKYRDEHFK